MSGQNVKKYFFKMTFKIVFVKLHKHQWPNEIVFRRNILLQMPLSVQKYLIYPNQLENNQFI